jgi:hypothetical protein
MGEQQIIKVLDLANHNQLEYLQGKVEYLSNEVKMLEEEKTNCTKHLLILNKRIDAYMKAMYTYESVLAQRREETDYLNQESGILRLDIRTGELTYKGDDI